MAERARGARRSGGDSSSASPPAAWVDAHSPVAGRYDAAIAALHIGGFIDFELLGPAKQPRGHVMAEVVGQGVDPNLHIGLTYIAPLATERPPIA